MNQPSRIWNTVSYMFGILVFIIGVLNILLVHPVPGMAYVLLSLLFIPPVNTVIRNKLGFGIASVIKVILGIAIIMFTLGVSDLGDMLDKQFP